MNIGAISTIDSQADKIPSSFFCKFLGRIVAINECLDDYVNANALNQKNSPCYRCPHGLKMRSRFADA